MTKQTDEEIAERISRSVIGQFDNRCNQLKMEIILAFQEANSQLAAKEDEISELKKEMEVMSMILNSFWKARKGLNLKYITVEDPGREITQEFKTKDATIAELESKLAKLYECPDGYHHPKDLVDSVFAQKRLERLEYLVEEYSAIQVPRLHLKIKELQSQLKKAMGALNESNAYGHADNCREMIAPTHDVKACCDCSYNMRADVIAEIEDNRG